MLRVLIADDSPTACAALAEILDSDSGLTVVGTARDGLQAVALAAKHRPDVMTMDVDMPGLDGFQATKEIMRTTPLPIVIVSSQVGEAVQSSLDALRAGALAVLAKPPAPTTPAYADYSRELVRTVKAMADVKLVQRLGPRPQRSGRRPKSARVIAVATSTGGPQALARVIGSLPLRLPVPVLVVQHIVSGFVAGLAKWLDRACPLRVKLASDGEPLEAGVVYVAPDDVHLAVSPGRPDRVALLDSPLEGGFRPSGTVLFRSVAEVYGGRSVCAILTGMGKDGVAGLRAVRAAGGGIIAQDEATSVVFGMPGEAVAADLTDAVVPLEDIADRLLAWVDGVGER